MISEIFCLSTKGETIFHKKYRFDPLDNVVEIFRKKLHDSNPNLLVPHWIQDQIHYHHIKRNNVYIVAVSRKLESLLVTEILAKLYQLMKDFCGSVSEDSLKSNIILVYELLDEFMDHGYVQLSSTDKLKPYIQSDPVTVRAVRSQQMTTGLFGVEYRAPAAPNIADKPVVRSLADQENRRDEIFLDVVERISVLMEYNSDVSRYELNGRVNMKCFLTCGGAPRIHIALNDDLEIGSDSGFCYGPNLKDHVLHEGVDRDRFLEKKELVLSPPQGEFTALTYSVSDQSQTPPIRFLMTTKENNSRESEVIVKLRANVPDNAEIINLNARITLPKSVQNINVLTKGPQQTLEIQRKDGYLLWEVKRLQGTYDTMAKFKITFAQQRPLLKAEVTPVILDFEISGHVTSGLAIKYLRLSDPNGLAIKPYRWIRYITVPDSYIVNINWSQ